MRLSINDEQEDLISGRKVYILPDIEQNYIYMGKHKLHRKAARYICEKCGITIVFYNNGIFECVVDNMVRVSYLDCDEMIIKDILT